MYLLFSIVLVLLVKKKRNSFFKKGDSTFGGSIKVNEIYLFENKAFISNYRVFLAGKKDAT